MLEDKYGNINLRKEAISHSAGTWTTAVAFICDVELHLSRHAKLSLSEAVKKLSEDLLTLSEFFKKERP
jgi:hypothetical protein